MRLLPLLVRLMRPSGLHPLAAAPPRHLSPALLQLRPLPAALQHQQQLMHTTTHQLNKFKQPPPRAAAASSGTSQDGTPASDLSSQQQTSPQPPARAPTKPRVVIITGPTAVGKTKLGLELAKHIGGEVISADSVQVYRGLDVGSDKLPVEQREGVPHHLIDILDPSQEFSAGDFHRLGRQAAEDIIARGKVPIVAGGTGFYLRWFTFGRPSTPASSPEAAAKALELIGQAWVRAAAEVAGAQAAAAAQTACSQQGVQPAAESPQQQAQQPSLSNPPPSSQQQAAAEHQDAVATAAAAAKLPPVSPEAARAALDLPDEQRWDAAVDVVADLGDAETAARIRAERNNWYRLQRVLQILVLNGGKPLSELDVDTTRELDYDFRCFFLHRPRLELFDRIVYRVEEMVAGGLLQEALMLLDRGMQPNSNIATRAIGYRQALEFLKAALAKGSASAEDLQQLILDIATASRNLVKNQTTWFRDDPMFRWVEVSGRSTQDVLQEVLAELDRPEPSDGSCGGDSGRFDKATLAALKRYVPSLKLFNDPDRVAAVLDWVAAQGAARTGRGNAGTGAGCDSAVDSDSGAEASPSATAPHDVSG